MNKLINYYATTSKAQEPYRFYLQTPKTLTKKYVCFTFQCLNTQHANIL